MRTKYPTRLNFWNWSCETGKKIMLHFSKSKIISNYWTKNCHLKNSLFLDTANTSYVPIYIFTNGTYAIPFLGTNGLTGLTGITTGLLGFGSILNFFPGMNKTLNSVKTFSTLKWIRIFRLWILGQEINFHWIGRDCIWEN